MVSALALPLSGALAQNQGGVDDEVLEEIITTGSRIARKDLTGAAAVTILDAEAIRVTGNVSIGDVLQDLTVNSNGINVQANNGGNGTTRINLRGLGSTRTLVLINGRRMVGTAGSSSVDLNALPLSIIERVEVLKDGASAVYGSDAVAGVVNIITRRDFEGVEINVFTGQAGESDGDIVDLNITLGVGNDRGNMMVSLGYYEQQEIMAGDRAFSNFDKSYDWTANDGSFDELGSSATPQGGIIDWTGEVGNAAWQTLTGVGGACEGGGFCYNDPSTGWRDFATTGTSDIGTGDYYNYQPVNYLLTPQKRINLYGSAHYDLGNSVSAFIETSYLSRQSDQLLAATPIFIISEGITFSADSVYNPFGRDFIDVRRRMLEAGQRNFLQDIDTIRTVAGFQGDIPGDKNWTWEASINYGRTQGIDVNEGRFIRSRVAEAIGPSYFDVDGVAQCGNLANPGSDGCVPLDLLGGISSNPITPEMIDYISFTGTDSLLQTQRTYSLNFSGDLTEMPAGTVGMAFGLEQRTERGEDLPDPLTATGNTTGNKRKPTAGSYDVTEAYLEFLVPIFDGVEASVAVRYSDYSNFGDTTNGKFGLIWNITDSFTVRGTVSEAFRAPTINGLFGGNADSFPLSQDPCDTSLGARTANQQAACAADGLPDDYVDIREQLKSVVGGNPDLKPESADTFTIGMVWQPGFLEGFSVTADWWDVDLTDAITGIGVGVILDQCYNQPAGGRSLCDKITRDAGTNFLSLIDDRTANVGGLTASGLDLTFGYDHSTSFGDFRYNLDITYLDDFTIEQADGTLINCVGVYDCGVYVENKANFNMNWRKDKWGANYNVRFIDEFIECDGDACSNLDNADPADDPVFRTVESNWQHDIQVSYDLDFGDAGQGTVSLGIQNLFDEDPAQIFNGFLATSDSSSYDFLGRYIYMSYRHTL